MKFLRVLFILGLAIVFAGGVFCGIYCYFIYGEMILPGIRVDEIPLQGLTKEEAMLRINLSYNQSRTITVVNTADVETTWEINPAEFGLAVDAIRTTEMAFQIGRQGSLIDGLDQFLWGIQYGHALQPLVTFNQDAAEMALFTWSSILNAAPVDPSLRIEEGSLIALPGLEGRAIDVGETLELVAADPQATLLEYQIIPLIMNTIPPEEKNVQKAEAVGQAYLESGAAIIAYDPILDEIIRWRPTQKEIGSWLEVEQVEGIFEIRFVPEMAMSYLMQLDDELGDERYFDHQTAYENLVSTLHGFPIEPLQIMYKSRVHQVRAWETLSSISYSYGIPYWKLLDANPELKDRTVRPGEIITLPAKDSMLMLPVVHNKRIVVSIPEQRMWLYQDGRLLREHVVSTGISRSPTMPGIFQVKSRYVNAYASIWDLYMPHFLGIYNATPNLENGIHGLPMLSNGVRLWANVLGKPASYGCIILDLEAAEDLYQWAEDGVVVEIIGSS